MSEKYNGLLANQKIAIYTEMSQAGQ